ncbi:MAG: glycosyltransferase family 4 protein [Verrucomicrobia bacterium]|nr:glycosyltransferase family 4 protein [Verrucomicrobiota bacterium]
MKRVLIITTNLDGSSFRLRLDPLKALLSPRGFQVEARLRPADPAACQELFRSAAGYDAVILQRKLLSPADARCLRRHARRLFFDVDDAVMFYAHPVGWVKRYRKRVRFRATTGALDHVVAGNEYLAGFFRERGCPVTVVPTMLDPAHYQLKQHAETRQPTLVWIGSHWTLPYLRQSLPALERAAASVPGLRLVVIADETVASSVLPVETIPWSQEGEAAALCRGDIGIAPTPLDPWTQGKCAFKIIQYMAAGLPVIASPVGSNAEVVVPGETGLLPTRSEEWVEAIIKLCRDDGLRARMGAAGRERVVARYSVQQAADTWARLLET